MRSDIEITDTQRKVDRVDVFERRDDVRQMRQAIGSRQYRESGTNHWMGRNRSASFKLPRR